MIRGQAQQRLQRGAYQVRIPCRLGGPAQAEQADRAVRLQRQGLAVGLQGGRGLPLLQPGLTEVVQGRGPFGLNAQGLLEQRDRSHDVALLPAGAAQKVQGFRFLRSGSQDRFVGRDGTDQIALAVQFQGLRQARGEFCCGHRGLLSGWMLLHEKCAQCWQYPPWRGQGPPYHPAPVAAAQAQFLRATQNVAPCGP